MFLILYYLLSHIKFHCYSPLKLSRVGFKLPFSCGRKVRRKEERKINRHTMGRKKGRKDAGGGDSIYKKGGDARREF